MQKLEKLFHEYHEILDLQKFRESELDYSVMENHIPFLEKLSAVNNSGITVFDMFKKKHIYTSYNFSEIFGYDLEAIRELGNEYFNSRVHPDDFPELMKTGTIVFRYAFSLPKDQLRFFKLVNEYRILSHNETWVRVIEQHQALELDHRGNIWLSLSVIDLSPDQSDYSGIKSQLINFKTGKLQRIQANHAPADHLTKREKEILQLVKEGYLSKEISDKLFISVHTVNTHRQRILEKLGANNSMEAVIYASRLGLVS
jgi:DNA-binding CsgD family transcriptional regulator